MKNFLRRGKRIENISCLNIDNKEVYYNEIIHPKLFEELYLIEKPIFKFSSKIILGNRPFVTFLAKDRKELFNEGDILLIRLFKGYKQVQFISKLYKWGRLHIPSKFIKLLGIKNHELLNIQINNKNQNLTTQKNYAGFIDLSKINAFVVPRKNDYVTIYVKRKTPITLPRFIRITSELLELFYLIHGDGHYQDKFYFANASFELHKFVLEQFENIFKIPSSLWKSRILISDMNLVSGAKFYWKNKLALEGYQFYSAFNSKFNTCNKGNLRIIIDKTIVSLVFKFIFNKLNLLKDEKCFLYALNGLLCAEGGVQIGDKGLHKITLSFNEKEKKMFKRILDNLGLKYIVSQNRTFVIQGWSNQYNFFKRFIMGGVIPFRVHSQRKERAISGFLAHSFTRTMMKYLSILDKNNTISVTKFSAMLKIRRDSLLDTLRKEQYQRFVSIKKHKNSFMISIKDEGLLFLYLINKMKKIKEEQLNMGLLPFEKEESKILVKKEASTDLRYGCKPEDRTVEQLMQYGVVNLNKPSGPTSHQVSDYVKKILNIDKVGHSGTLVD